MTDAIRAYLAKRAARRTLDDFYPTPIRVVHPLWEGLRDER